MITGHQALAFALVSGVLIAIPGPSVVFTISRALAYGRSTALATVFGNALGMATVIVLVAFGLGIVVEESETAFMVLKLAGAAYLVWLGIQAVRHRHEFTGEAGSDGLLRPALRLRTAIRQGYVVGVSNPKGFVIIGAILPQFVDRSSGSVQVQMLLLGAIQLVIGLLSDSLWAVVAARLRTWFLASRKRGATLGAVGGLSMIGLGVSLAVSGRD